MSYRLKVGGRVIVFLDLPKDPDTNYIVTIYLRLRANLLPLLMQLQLYRSLLRLAAHLRPQSLLP